MKISDSSMASPTGSSPSARLLLAATVSVLGGGFHFGFQISLVNPMSSVLQAFLQNRMNNLYGISPSEGVSALIWSIVVSILLVGAVIGSIVVTNIIETRGPLRALTISAIILLYSFTISAVSGVTNSAELFVLGRFFSGIGVGMAASAQGVFLTEISPRAHKGKIGTLGGLSTNIGFVTAAALGLPFALGRDKLWYLVFVIEALPCIVRVLIVTISTRLLQIFIISSLTWIQESPVFLLKTGQLKQAKCAVASYGCTELYDDSDHLKEETISNSSLVSIWKENDSKKALCLSVILNIAVSFSGITAVSFFGTHMLRSLGFTESSAATMNCLCSTAGTAGALLATITTDRVGSRVLVLSGLIVLAFLDTLMMLLVYLYSATKLPLVGWMFFTLFVLFLFVFSAGIGPAAWSLGAELSPNSCRAKVQSIAVCTQYCACFISPVLYYPLTEAVGPLSFLIFIVPLLIIAGYLFQHLPEQKKGKEEAEIEKF